MPKVPPDYSFEREGRPLGEWLHRLVADRRSDREPAGKALQAMRHALPSTDVSLENVEPLPDLLARMASFAEAIRQAVAAPGFDAPEFVRRLCAYTVAISDEWHRRVDASFERKAPGEEQWERISEKLVARINASADETVRREATRRLTRALCAITAREQQIDEESQTAAEALSLEGIMAHVVLQSLDAELLAAPEALLLLLERKHESHSALEALARIGPPAVAFAPLLLERIQRTEGWENSYPDGEAAALGSVARGNGPLVDQVRRCLHDSHVQVRSLAASTLTRMGSDVAGREADIVADLLVLVEQEASGSLVRALASVGSRFPAARRRVIELARPRPAVWVPIPGFPDRKSDRTMIERGDALSAMQYLSEYAEECLPVLIEALDSFEEFDPDQSYGGPVSRIAYVLKSFGAAAGPAAIPLAEKLQTPMDDGHPRAILEALAAIGPAARGALPRLERFRAATAGSQPLPDLTESRPDECADPVGWTMWAIEGRHV